MASRRKITRWGDRDGRVRDILTAARELIEELGYADFQMRATARRARVSPATLYFYFQTKEEIFLTLMSRRLEQLATEAKQIAARAEPFDQRFAAFAAAYLDFYRAYGRHLNLMALLADEGALARLPDELVRTLRAQVGAIFATVAAAMDGEGGLRREPLTLPLLWAVLTGLAESFSGPRAHAASFDWDDMAAYAGRVLAAGLRARPPETDS